jgi:hypothetical protein
MFNGSQTIIEAFDCHTGCVGARWDEWRERLEQLFEASEIDATKGERRVNTLFLLGGSDLQRIHKTLPVDVPAASGEAPERTDYDKAIYRLNVYFNPMRNKNVEQYLFSAAKQDESETITQYVTRLRILVTYCLKCPEIYICHQDKEIRVCITCTLEFN